MHSTDPIPLPRAQDTRWLGGCQVWGARLGAWRKEGGRDMAPRAARRGVSRDGASIVISQQCIPLRSLAPITHRAESHNGWRRRRLRLCKSQQVTDPTTGFSRIPSAWGLRPVTWSLRQHHRRPHPCWRARAGWLMGAPRWISRGRASIEALLASHSLRTAQYRYWQP